VARASGWAGARLVMALVLAVYALACVLPVIAGGDGPLPGWACLLLCWRPPLCLPWSANVFLAAGLFCLGRGRCRLASWLGSTAALLGLTTWAFVDRHVAAGYFLWQGSLVLLALGGHVLAASTDSPLPGARGAP
jgi:hypothetical protein